MREENVKVIIWGFGSMGKGMGNMLLQKEGIDIVGVIDGWDKQAGKGIFEILGKEYPGKEDVKITFVDDKAEIIKPGAADVVLLATDSFTAKAYDKIEFILKNKINCITTAEQMAYPQAQEPELAEKMDKIAKENGVSVLGTGINPGLIMDYLVLVLSGACESVDHVTARRVNSLSPFGPAVMEEQGVGFTVDRFNELNEKGELAGHVGFDESISMIAEAFGWNLEKIETSQDAIVSSVYRKAPYAEVQAGDVAGVNMLGHGICDGEKKIEMIHPQQVEPQLEGVDTGDYITLKGEPSISMAITPEVPGGVGTYAMIVNSIPNIINATPGLKTMVDLPAPHAMMGDVRKLIK